MTFKFMEKCDCHEDCQAIDRLFFEYRNILIHWFDDFGYKFVRVEIGSKTWERQY